MNLLEKTISSIVQTDPTIGMRTQALLDQKTKPRGSMGRLEELACTVATIRGKAKPGPMKKAVVVMAADHGIAAEGVSAYPQAVTAQMLLNFASGGAAINVLSRQVGAEVLVVDMGTLEPPPRTTAIRCERIAAGTRNFTVDTAMSVEQVVRALETGIRIADDLAAGRMDVIGLGEMGIGNTTSASALTAAFTGHAPEDVTGRGTGIDDATLQTKIRAIRKALDLHRPVFGDPLKTLAALGGFEIAGLTGLALGAAAHRMVVVLDGFISSAAGLAAARLAPAATDYLLASHQSVESGQQYILKDLNKKPLLNLDLRLGEGTGTTLAMHLIDSALLILNEMATFESAGVSDTGK